MIPYKPQYSSQKCHIKTIKLHGRSAMGIGVACVEGFGFSGYSSHQGHSKSLLHTG